MKLALLGSKQKVKGFDIELHTKHKLGVMYKSAAGDQENSENTDSDTEQQPEQGKEEVAQNEEEAKAEEADAVDAGDEDEVKVDEDDQEDEAEIQKLIKEEDINLVPEDLDVSEIDKLTGIPKPGGKYTILIDDCFRLTVIRNPDVSTLYYHKYFQV